MKARILIIAVLVTGFAGVLPAVDQTLLGMVMPDAKVLAGVNVVSAVNSPFGQYILAQMAPKEQEFQTMATMTGFDPRKDLVELLAATNGVPGSNSGVVLAKGTFLVSAITTAATSHGATVEQYNGATIVTDPNSKTPAGIAFLGSSIAVAGPLDQVKAAVDRQSKAAVIDQNLKDQASALSGTQDAWFVSLIGPPPLQLPTGKGGTPVTPIPTNALQQIVGGSAGVKFGANVVVTAQATADNATDATNIAGMLQFLQNMAKMQADKNPQAAELANALTVSATGNTINATFTISQDQIQKLTAPHPAAARKTRPEPKK
jgi:hypothetical protein